MSTAALPRLQTTIADVVNRCLTLYIARAVMGFTTWCILAGITWLALFWLDNLLRLPMGLCFPLAWLGES